jgi:hypothetical protein
MLVLAALLGYVGLSSIGTFKDLFDNTVEKTVRKLALADAIVAHCCPKQDRVVMSAVEIVGFGS